MWFLVFILVVFFGVYFLQPYRYDVFPRPAPNAGSLIDPDSSLLFQKGTKVTVITAHPDDSEFYIGGLLDKLSRSGAELNLIICTRGDKIYNPLIDHVKTANIRSAEQIEAAEMWRASGIAFLSGHDGRLPADNATVEDIA